MFHHLRRICKGSVLIWMWSANCLCTASAAPITLDMVTVGDPGNAADTSPAGRGAVATSFQIMKYEFTNQLIRGVFELESTGRHVFAIQLSNEQ